MTILEEAEWLDELLVERIKYAVNDNPQVQRAFGVPDRVNNLVKKFSDEG